MSFTYTRDIPFATHTPASDQPNMQVNTNSTDDLIQVDHISFNDANAGKHNHVTFHNAQSDPTLQNSETQIYPKTFGSGTTYLETYTAAKTNGGAQINGYLPFVKCMVRFTSIAMNGAITPTAGYLNVNVNTVVQSAGGNVITVTFTTALPSNTYYIFYGSGSTVDGTITVTKNTGTIVFTRGLPIPNTVVFELMVI